jgi:hypothetical protein
VGHARELAAEAAQQGTKLIIACGGDGTISEVANGIIESKQETELAILPVVPAAIFGGRSVCQQTSRRRRARCAADVRGR